MATPSNSKNVPARRFFGESMSCMVNSLLLSHEREERQRAEGNDPGTLFGYRIPFFQRTNDRWSRLQQVDFIQSLYMGANVGSFMVNIPSISVPRELDNVLLDGLQRLTAMKSYFLGEFAVPGEDGIERLWTELDPREDQPHLMRITFPWVLTRYNTFEQMIEAYDRHNFGGEPHTAEDRARLKAQLEALRGGDASTDMKTVNPLKVGVLRGATPPEIAHRDIEVVNRGRVDVHGTSGPVNVKARRPGV